MRPDEVRELLEEASADVAEPDLADSAWAGAAAISRRRRRRRTALAAAAGTAAVVVTAIVAGPPSTRTGDPVGPTPQPVPTATGRVPTAGTIAGMPYWVAPPVGSERFLDRIDTALGDKLVTPAETLDDLKLKPIDRIAAVLLRKVPGADRYRPVVLGAVGRWAEASIELVPTRDSGGNQALPLDATAVSPDGGRIAFTQPNGVIVLDASTGDGQRIPVSSATIENVAWLPSGDRLLVSGDDGVFLVVVGPGSDEGQVQRVTSGADPWAVTAPFALDREGGSVVLARYDVNGMRHVDQRLTMPVSQWFGMTFTSRTLVARSFFANPVPELEGKTVSTGPQMIAVVEAEPGTPGKLLVLDDASDTTHRFKGCCSVLGWYDDRTVLFDARSGPGQWILGWDVLSGQVRRVTELEVDVVALGPGVSR